MIEVHGLTKHFGGRPAIVDLTFSVPRGQVLGLLGPEGAGKSTVLRILAGLLGATSGTATVAGLDVLGRSREARRRIGYLAEGAPLQDGMRVDTYLRLACRLRGVPPPGREARITAALAAAGIVDRAHEVIGRLPAELRPRVGLAEAVVHDPAVVLLDAPAGGLSGPVRGLGRTVVVATRHLADAVALCDRALVLSEGRVVADRDTGDLGGLIVRRPRREVVAVVRGDGEEARRVMASIAGVSGVASADLGQGAHRLTVTGEGEDLQDAVARAIVVSGLSLSELSSREPADAVEEAS